MSKSRHRFNQLEGLRGIAAFVVVLGHLRHTFFFEARNTWNANGQIFGTVAEAMFDGNFAVWIFWVMSAFVLSLRFHVTDDHVASRSILSDALIRRYPRLLLPVLISVFFAWALHASGSG